MAEPYIGEIRMMASNFAPKGYANCDGQILPINQNQALFSILGTTYGGNGQTSFALPDMRGRAPIHAGGGPGLTPRSLGQKGGVETVTLVPANLPPHSHALHGAATPAGETVPQSHSLAHARADVYASGSPSVALAADSVTAAGASQSHANMQPSLAIRFVIALVGVYPSQN